jgi:hypothetical protein
LWIGLISMLNLLFGPVFEHRLLVVFLLQFQLLLESFDLVWGLLQLDLGLDEETTNLVDCEFANLLRNLTVHLFVLEKTLQSLLLTLHNFHIIQRFLADHRQFLLRDVNLGLQINNQLLLLLN